MSKWDARINAIQSFLLMSVLLTIGGSIAVLLMFDTLAGAAIGNYLSRGNTFVAIIISIATTGLLTAFAFLAVLAKKRGYETAGGLMLVLSFIFLAIDVYFDSLGADVLHYGTHVVIMDLPKADRWIQILYRVLLGGLSTVGEPLAFALIIGLPDLRQFLKGIMPFEEKREKPKAANSYNQNSPAMQKIKQNTAAQQYQTLKDMSEKRIQEIEEEENQEPTFQPIRYQA